LGAHKIILYSLPSASSNLGDVIAGTVDMDLFDGQFPARLHIVTQEHLTKAANAELPTALPVLRSFRSYKQTGKHTVCMLANVFTTTQFYQPSLLDLDWLS